MSQIVYIGSFLFPLGDAVAKRVLGVGMALREAMYTVSYIGEDKNVPSKCVSEERIYDGFRYCCLHKPKSSKEHYDIYKDVQIIEKLLKRWSEEDEIEAVFFCGMKCSLMAAKVVKICKKMGILIVADSMDWLQVHTGNRLFDIVKQADIEYELRVVNKKADGIMAISDYLSNYYTRCGKCVITVPPLSPYKRLEKIKERDSNITRVVYAGIPCRLGQPLLNPHDAKDRLDIAMELFYRAFKKGITFQFNIYGLSKEEYKIVFPAQNSIIDQLTEAGKVIFWGYSTENIVRKAVEQADYTILLREKTRTSMAGFPTKIAESIALGTPVITTRTSSIDSYLEEGKQAFYIGLNYMDEAETKVNRLLNLAVSERVQLKQQALLNTSFVPDTYNDKLREYLKVIFDNKRKHRRYIG